MISPSLERTFYCALMVLLFFAATGSPPVRAETPPRGITFERIAGMRSVSEVEISPDGSTVAYRLSVPRRPGEDDDGAAWVELHVVPAEGGSSRAYVHGEVNVSNLQFTPDGRHITYLAKRAGDEHRSLWAIPISGGESRTLVTHETSVIDYEVSPDGTRIVFVATEKESEEREDAKEKGYKQEIYGEDWRPRKVWIAAMPPERETVADPSADQPEEDESDDEPRSIEVEGSAFNATWGPNGKRLAVTVAPTPLIDDRYMGRRIHVIDADSGKVRGRIENPGKLGRFELSPDGKNVAMISAADPNDPKEGRLLVARASGGPPSDAMPGFDGHVHGFAWLDARTIVFLAGVGVESELREVDIRSGDVKTHLRSNGTSRLPWLGSISASPQGTRFAFTGDSPMHPAEVFVMDRGQTEPRKLTEVNPWLADVDLASQETLRWKSRDGLELEGLLIHPLEPAAGTPAPLLLMVHGGPESHDRNGWITNYSRPGQLAAAMGYAVLYPNYRGSTGRGVEFSKLGQGDAAGAEFDDLVDAVDHLVAAGVADRDRVGINGGSYGGYATAWCSTYHSEHFRAGVMFVGISNKISKGLTTEIPVEDKLVHTRFDPWTHWEFSLERSPVYHAEKSRTALLISGGTADTRVHPSQSLQLYNALKLIGKTPVRYVRYPGEGHGNRKAAARDDYGRRLIRWMNHFVRDKKEDLPPWELELPGDKDEDEDDDSED